MSALGGCDVHLDLPGVGGLAAAVPSALVAADAAVNGDVSTMLTQLGIGAALVAFAVWLQDKFRKQSKDDTNEAITRERELTQKYIDLLEKQLDKE
jgi:hypothetical protein